MPMRWALICVPVVHATGPCMPLSYDCTGSPCVNNTCVCDPGFTGSDCAQAALGEATVAFREEQNWVWGTSAVRDANGSYHAFTLELKHRCGIQHYRHNSYIVHATSASPLGPFVKVATALDARPGFFDGVEVEDPAIITVRLRSHTVWDPSAQSPLGLCVLR